MADRGVLEAMRDSSSVIRGLNLGSRRGGREDWGLEEGVLEASAAMRDSAAARSAAVGSASTSRCFVSWVFEVEVSVWLVGDGMGEGGLHGSDSWTVVRMDDILALSVRIL